MDKLLESLLDIDAHDSIINSTNDVLKITADFESKLQEATDKLYYHDKFIVDLKKENKDLYIEILDIEHPRFNYIPVDQFIQEPLYDHIMGLLRDYTIHFRGSSKNHNHFDVTSLYFRGFDYDYKNGFQKAMDKFFTIARHKNCRWSSKNGLMLNDNSSLVPGEVRDYGAFSMFKELKLGALHINRYRNYKFTKRTPAIIKNVKESEWRPIDGICDAIILFQNCDVSAFYIDKFGGGTHTGYIMFKDCKINELHAGYGISFQDMVKILNWKFGGEHRLTSTELQNQYVEKHKEKIKNYAEENNIKHIFIDSNDILK